MYLRLKVTIKNYIKALIDLCKTEILTLSVNIIYKHYIEHLFYLLAFLGQENCF